jgi:hypothetical protein
MSPIASSLGGGPAASWDEHITEIAEPGLLDWHPDRHICTESVMGQQMAKDADQITAMEFESKCLRLMEKVAKQRTPLVITKDGKPWVKVMPIIDQPIDICSCMAGSIEIIGDIISPIDEDQWTGDVDNI